MSKHTAGVSPIVIDLLRHGEVEGPAAVARGCHTDAQLTDHGWRQMQAVGIALREQGSLQSIATSPLSRCATFAGHLGQQLALPVQRLNAMREIDFGRWEGKQGYEIAEQDALQCFMQNPAGVLIPEGESIEQCAARVLAGWQAWLDQLEGGHHLLVAHGVVIRVLLAGMLGLPLSCLWRLTLPYAAWSRVSVLQGEQPRLLFLNREPD